MKEKKPQEVIRYGFLYVTDNQECLEAEKILAKGQIRIQKSNPAMDPQSGDPFITPTFITREGTFRGLEAIRAYLGWFVYDPLYDKRRATICR